MATPDPIERFAVWSTRARRSGDDPESMALATAATNGHPAVRFVLLKQVDGRGFVFFTDARSRKGQELVANPWAAAALFWPTSRRQVRVEGRVERVSPAEADAYWTTRPRASRLEARASHQSATLRSRASLLVRWKALCRRYRGRPIPRPATWTGFRIVPQAIEFWTHRNHRLHDRERFVRARRGWRRELLQP
jgi:pyridoxamine 5'-phosphate oxidase